MFNQIARIGWIVFGLFFMLSNLSFTGNDLSFKPRSVFAQYYQYVIEKRCSNCNRVVPNSSHAGQRCPHCGAYWSYETSTGMSSAGSTSEEPSGETVTIHFGEESFEVNYREKNDSILVPIRVFSENLGFSVIWTPPESIRIASGQGLNIYLAIGQKTANVIEQGVSREIELTLAPEIFSGRSYIPLRNCAELLGFQVDYKDNENGREVNLSLLPLQQEDQFFKNKD